MIRSDRVRELIDLRGTTQSALAREVRVTQGAIAKIASKNPGGSSHLHKIARALRTTPEYLTGEIDDPDVGAPPPPPPTPPRVLFEIVMPPEDALTRMFEVLLDGIRPGAGRDELAQLLAQRLPIGLSQLSGPLRREPARREPGRAASDPRTVATHHPEPQP